MASSPRCCRRRCTEPPPAARDWAALPRDILCAVFLELRTLEIMRGAEFACTAWRRVAVEEPELWRRIHMDSIWMYSKAWRPIMVRAALDRSAGQCAAFSGPCDNHSLLDLVERAPSLKSLHLFNFVACNEVLDKALKQLPLLEDLEISPSCPSSKDSKFLFEPVCKARPRLKKLLLARQKIVASEDEDDWEWDHQYFYAWLYDPSVKKQIIRTSIMSELRSLELFDCELSTNRLSEILGRCPLLESLHITGPSAFVYGKMNKKLRMKCARLRKLTIPNNLELADDSCDEDYYFLNESDEDYDY